MKTRFLPLLGLLALAFIAVAAEPAVTSRLTFIGTNPAFHDNGTVAALPVQAMFTDSAVVAGKPMTAQSSVSWDAIATASHVITYTYGGTEKTITRGELAAALIADAIAVKNPPPPAPEPTPPTP